MDKDATADPDAVSGRDPRISASDARMDKKAASLDTRCHKLPHMPGLLGRRLSRFEKEN